jgi:hypothetical protein
MIALVALVTIAGLVTFGRSHSTFPNLEAVSTTSLDNRPSSEQETFAKATSDLMHNELVAALFQEFNETTPENVENGKQAISLIFNDANRDMRLIGVFPPLQGGFNGFPSDSFERKSLTLALQGKNNESVERVGDRWYYRTSIALSNTFHASCVLCHTNFTPEFFTQTHNDGQWVGALVTRVPIKED